MVKEFIREIEQDKILSLVGVNKTTDGSTSQSSFYSSRIMRAKTSSW